MAKTESLPHPDRKSVLIDLGSVLLADIPLLSYELEATFRISYRFDPKNSFLNEVMERKRGIPITLSVLYMEVAQRIGLPLLGVGFPGHFLVKYIDDEQEIVIDPFNDGEVLSTDSLETLLRHVQLTPCAIGGSSCRKCPVHGPLG